MRKLLAVVCLTVFVLSVGAGVAIERVKADEILCSFVWDDVVEMYECCCPMAYKPNGDPIVRCKWVTSVQRCPWFKA